MRINVAKTKRWAIGMLIVSGAFSFPSTGHAKNLAISAAAMALTNSTTQGGIGPAGSTVLTQANISYRFDWWAAGAFFEYDLQGANETDMTYGGKLELFYKVVYAELGFGLVNRGFTDRTIANQSGTSYQVGAGVRVPLGSGKVFLDFSYKYRIQVVVKQDTTYLTNPLIQADGYPMFGFGVAF